MHIAELPTPCAVVDLDRLDANTAKLQSRINGLGCALRPHIKTHKCVEAARYQLRGRNRGICVSTFAEAHAFAAAGFSDITLAFPLGLGRIDEALDLAETIDRFAVLSDRGEVIEALASRARPIDLWIEIDCGDHRGGHLPQDPTLLEQASRVLNASSLRFAGLLTHAGHSYAARSLLELRAIAAREVEALHRGNAALEAAGLEARELSLGSTPTASVVEDLAGIDECRPGNYVFYDLTQVALGSCTLDDVAFSVLTTVVGLYPEQRRLIVDAGALAVGKDLGPSHLVFDGGYGLLMDERCEGGFPELKIQGLSQEHGQVHAREGRPFPEVRLGQRLRILPNHSCLSAALHSHYAVVRGEEVIDEWSTFRGW